MGGEVVQSVLRLKEREGRRGVGWGGGGGWWLVVEEHSHRDCLSKSDSRVVESLYACNGRWKYRVLKVE